MGWIATFRKALSVCFIIVSKNTPWCWLSGVLNFHFVLHAIANFPILFSPSWSTSSTQRSQPANDVPLSEMVTLGKALWDTNRLNALKKASLDKPSTISRCVARVVAHVKRAPFALILLLRPYLKKMHLINRRFSWKREVKRPLVFLVGGLPLTYCKGISKFATGHALSDNLLC